MQQKRQRRFKEISDDDDSQVEQVPRLLNNSKNPLHRNRLEEETDDSFMNSNSLIQRFKMLFKEKVPLKDLNRMYVGSVVCFGVANQAFTTKGKEKQLKPFFKHGSYGEATTLYLQYQEHEIFVPTILADQLRQLHQAYRHLGEVRFFCTSGQDDHDRRCEVEEFNDPNKGKKKKREKKQNDFAPKTASKKIVLKQVLKKIMAIRMDIYINKNVFNEVDSTYSGKIKQLQNIRKMIQIINNTKSQEHKQLIQQYKNKVKQVENEQVVRGLLLYFMEKAKIKVLNRSFIKPPPKLNVLMRDFRAKTIGLITKNKRYARRIENKIAKWKKNFQFMSLFYPCVLNEDLVKEYYEHRPLQSIVWKNDPCQFYKQIQEEQFKKLKSRQFTVKNEGRESPFSDFLGLNMKRVMNQVGAHGFGNEDEDQEEQIQEGEESRESGRVKKMDMDEAALLKKNKFLMERFQMENKHFRMHENPTHMVSNLKPYQKQALQWMKYREGKLSVEQLFEENYGNESDEYEFQRKLSPFWEQICSIEGDRFYVNYLTGEFTKIFHDWKQIKGGILADEMGLGKTVMTLSLLADQNFIGLNLIVVPVTVLLQWKSQIEKHCGKGIKVLEYHSLSKNRRKINLRDYQIILITYSTLGSQYKAYANRNNEEEKDENYLFNYNFQRVILDEAHNIKGTSTLQFKGVMELKSKYSWCLTGTLIQNSQQDLFAIFKFLRVEVFSEESWWNQYIKNAGCLQAKLNVIQTVLRPIVLRRTKKSTSNDGESIIQLTQKFEHTIKPSFSEAQQKIYLKLKNGVREYFRSNVETQRSYTHVFQILIKLRQFCCHPALIFKENAEDISEQSIQEMISNFLAVRIKGEYKDTAIQAILDEQKECPICSEAVKEDEAVFTNCGHIFCQPCLKKAIEMYRCCSVCRRPLNESCYKSKNQLLHPSEIKEIKEVKEMNESTKVNEILKLLRKIEEKGEKCVIFTQWIKIIDLLEQKLLLKGIQFAIIQGNMRPEQRQRAVRRFQQKPSCIFLIASIKAAGTGLNLVNANNVIICDPWWNPAQEEQAIGRVHRIGQTKEVNVYRFLMKDSIQESIEAMHEKKKRLAEQVMMQRGSLDDNTNKVEELLRLLD